MRVLHIINNLNKGGAERLLVDNLPLYKNAEIVVEVLQLSSLHSEPQYIKLLEESAVKCSHLSKSNIYNPFLIFKLISFISAGKFDIIHVHLFPAMYWSAIASKFINPRPLFVFTEHSTQNKRSGNSFFQPIDRFIYKSYDSIIAISEQIQTKLVNWTGMPQKICVIHNGVNTLRFSKAPKYDEAFWFNEFKIPANSIKLLMTARFSYPKDQSAVVSALKHLPENHCLILVGEGPDKEKVAALANDLGLSSRVIFTGFRNDVASLMKSVHVNILSTHYEGMSGVSLEAMASENPFLGSDVAGINDIVPDSRFLFKAGDSHDIGLKITNIVNNKSLQTSMVQDATQHIKKFNIEDTIKNHIKLYLRLIAR